MKTDTVREIMDIDIYNLAEKQHDTLKEFTIGKLKRIGELIANEEYDKVKNMLAFSPAGDGYGCDNYYINLSFKENERMDIGDIIDLLENLKIN